MTKGKKMRVRLLREAREAIESQSAVIYMTHPSSLRRLAYYLAGPWWTISTSRGAVRVGNRNPAEVGHVLPWWPDAAAKRRRADRFARLLPAWIEAMRDVQEIEG